MYSEKATKFCKTSTLLLSYVLSASQKEGGDFAKFCGLLRMYELRYTRPFTYNQGASGVVNKRHLAV